MTGNGGSVAAPGHHVRGEADPELEFVDLRETRDDAELLEALHRELFLPNFRDVDEQEGPKDWAPRLQENPPALQPEQHAFVAGTHFESATERSLAGFAFVERYRESRCALLSFIAIDESQRGKQLARELFDRALGSAKKAAKRDGAPIRAVFAEIHDPRRVKREDDVIDPADRVGIMARLGAWRVPVTYVQPALDERGSRSDRLMLIAFPLDGKPTVDPGVLAEFLSEYYRSLGIDDPAGDPDLVKIMNELKEFGRGPVDLVPLSPSFEFERFGVVLHFVGKVGNEERTADARPDRAENPFESFEEDLLSYRYLPRRPATEIPDRPFESEIVRDYAEPVELSVTVPIVYHSEGSTRRFSFPPLGSDGVRKVGVRASRTRFIKSGYSVFHLALVPSGAALDEYDLVALSKLWQSGEAHDAAKKIRVNGESVEAFARDVFEGDAEWKEPDALVRGGTIQLITDNPPRGVTWTTIWDSVNTLRAEEDGDKERIADEIAKATPLGRQVKALGGIVQGILDFHAIDATELADVFAALEVDSGSLVGVHKGTLLCVMESDRSYDASAQAIGVSPYLLLPQAVLLHNEALLDRVARLAQSVKEKEDHVELADCFRKMRRLLACYVPNVFHYPQERRLFEIGERTRGLAERRQELFARADEVETSWNVAVEKRRSSADTLRNILLALIGLSTFGVGVAVGLSFLAVSLVVLSLHSNPRWSWWPPRAWWSFVRRSEAADRAKA